MTVKAVIGNESCPEVDGVADMPGVYKLSMVRMVSNLTKTADVRVYKTEHVEMRVA